MYARSTSVSNGGLGGERGDTAPDRKTGERSPRDVILARENAVGRADVRLFGHTKALSRSMHSVRVCTV